MKFSYCVRFIALFLLFTFNDICLYGKTTECNAEKQSSHVEIVQNVVNENFLTADEFIEIVNNWDALASSDFFTIMRASNTTGICTIYENPEVYKHDLPFDEFQSVGLYVVPRKLPCDIKPFLDVDYQVKNSIIFSMEPQEIVLSALRTQDMDYESFRDEIDIMLKIIRERAAGECEILLPAFFKVSDCNDVRKVEVCESTVVFNIEQRILQQESALPTIKQQDFSRFVDENINTATQELGTSICNLALKDHTRPAFLTTDGYLVILCSDVVLKDFVPCAEEKISHVLVFDLLADTIQLVDDFTSQN